MDGLLKGATGYLAGPIEAVSIESAIGWRDAIAPRLVNLGMRVWNPLSKPDWIDKNFDGIAQRADKEFFKSMPSEQVPDIHYITKRNVQIHDVALRLASAADFIICKLGGVTTGTFSEIELAKICKKPVLFFGDLDSSWRFVHFNTPNYRVFHKDMDDLVSYLSAINNGSIKVDNVDWIFLKNNWTEQ